MYKKHFSARTNLGTISYWKL